MKKKTISFQRLDERATLPTRATAESCGLDIAAIEAIVIPPRDRAQVHTGLAVSIPSGHYGRVAPRSGLALRFGIDILAGVIDSDYRGELVCLLINHSDRPFTIQVGDRIAQLVIERIALLTPTWSESLETTERGIGGFGSSE